MGDEFKYYRTYPDHRRGDGGASKQLAATGSWRRCCHEAMAIEMGLVNVPFQSEVELPVVYKGRKLKTYYRADFLCFESVILEVEGVSELNSIHESQVLNCLKATGLRRSASF